jgi:hypothetical protein
MTMEIRPVSFADAKIFLDQHHRHHKKIQGWKFGTSVWVGEKMVGVITIGRPVSRVLDDGSTLEVTRCCTDGTPNACSMLYAAAWRAGKSLGYTRMVTYTFSSEHGTSLRAAGWIPTSTVQGRQWTCKSRPRELSENDTDKTRWEAV